MQYVLMCQLWTESERGWGQRPDGYSLHMNTESRDAYIKADKDAKPTGPAPDVYSFAEGSCFAVLVTEDVYQEVLKSREGVMYSGNHPPKL